MVAEKNKTKAPPKKATGEKEADTRKAAAKLDALLKMVSVNNENRKLDGTKQSLHSAPLEISQREGRDVTPATETMARILEEQGHLKKARALRKELLEYAQWQIVSPPEQKATEITEPGDNIENHENRVFIVPAEENTPTILLSWNISREVVKTVLLSLPSCLLEGSQPEQIIHDIMNEKKRLVTTQNKEGEKKLRADSRKNPVELNRWENPVKINARLTATFPDKEGATKKVFDLPLTTPKGQVFIAPLTNRPLWVCASLGLKAWTGRFVSAVHSELMRIPDLHKSK